MGLMFRMTAVDNVIRFFYFDIRGRGETSRLLLTLSGKKWEDKRVPKPEWPALKPKTPYGHLPFMEYNGKQYAQSMAIEMFLAEECGLRGKTSLDLLRTLEVTNLKDDFFKGVVKEKFEPDAAVKAELTKKMVEEEVPAYLGFFERLLKDNGGNGHFIGNAMTLADLSMYDICDTFLAYNPKALDKFPEVTKCRNKVGENPKIKTYVAGRKKTDL